jgi:hypothetical protein
MSGQPTVIYRAANPQQAHLLKHLLEEQGIAAWIDNENIQIAGGELPLGWTAAPRVVVGENDAEEALLIAHEFDTTTAHGPTPDDEPDAESTLAQWTDWPKCPGCSERRQARCPVCGSCGTEFPLADIDVGKEEEGKAEPKVLLICASCDDHFRPEFFRLCHRCGQDFGSGIEVGMSPSRADENRRVWFVLAGLVAGAAAFIAYFAHVMR